MHLVVAPLGAAPGADGGVLPLLFVDADVWVSRQAAAELIVLNSELETGKRLRQIVESRLRGSCRTHPLPVLPLFFPRSFTTLITHL